MRFHLKLHLKTGFIISDPIQHCISNNYKNLSCSGFNIFMLLLTTAHHCEVSITKTSLNQKVCLSANENVSYVENLSLSFSQWKCLDVENLSLSFSQWKCLDVENLSRQSDIIINIKQVKILKYMWWYRNGITRELLDKILYFYFQFTFSHAVCRQTVVCCISTFSLHSAMPYVVKQLQLLWGEKMIRILFSDLLNYVQSDADKQHASTVTSSKSESLLIWLNVSLLHSETTLVWPKTMNGQVYKG